MKGLSYLLLKPIENPVFRLYSGYFRRPSLFKEVLAVPPLTSFSNADGIRDKSTSFRRAT